MANLTEVKYRPFPNGSAYEYWSHDNCQHCKFGSFDDMPTCPGDMGIILALMGDGRISEAIADFIGTSDRHTENGRGYCDLNRNCNHFAYVNSDAELPPIVTELWRQIEEETTQEDKPINKPSKPMATELIGVIKEFLPIVSGNSNNGAWTKQEFLVETLGQYPKVVAITDFNEKANAIGHSVGATVKVSLELSSRQYNDKWYHNITAYKVEPHGDNAPAAKQPAAPRQAQPARPTNTQMAPQFTNMNDDQDSNSLPF